MGIKPQNIKEIESKASNIYEAIVLVARRARQINEEQKIEFNQRMETINALSMPISAEEDEPGVNPDQIKISVEFDKRPKIVDLALTELLKNKLQYTYPDKETK
ncbi:MAG: DNA-directed RNA polymerase subunit omega [Bacteroidetes bacterium]|nr:DNA-directed RNA polymerase subunit omega [Bacteroidota bacterium]